MFRVSSYKSILAGIEVFSLVLLSTAPKYDSGKNEKSVNNARVLTVNDYYSRNDLYNSSQW